MNQVVVHFDAAQDHPVIGSQGLVVVTGDQDHAGALARLLEYLLQHAAVHRRPMAALAQVPEIDDVAHQEQLPAAHLRKEVAQVFGAAAGKAEVYVGNRHGTDVARTVDRSDLAHRGPSVLVGSLGEPDNKLVMEPCQSVEGFLAER